MEAADAFVVSAGADAVPPSPQLAGGSDSSVDGDVRKHAHGTTGVSRGFRRDLMLCKMRGCMSPGSPFGRPESSRTGDLGPGGAGTDVRGDRLAARPGRPRAAPRRPILRPWPPCHGRRTVRPRPAQPAARRTSPSLRVDPTQDLAAPAPRSTRRPSSTAHRAAAGRGVRRRPGSSYFFADSNWSTTLSLATL